MPKVALAPLMMIWVGVGMTSKIIITTIVALFPVMVNVIIGLRSVDPDRINLVRSLKGDQWAEFRYVRLPSAASYIFAGMKTAVVLSLLAAIAAEFVGAEAGLGYLMTQMMFRLDTAGVFAVLILLAAIGIILFLFADWLHRRVVFWDQGARDRLSGS
jgi:NitT/TauT family transport system permease protein